MAASPPRSTKRRVLSIQSHVVYGYVGNKAATFPLQILGYDVDPLNAVHFSNHSGYPTVKGERLNGDQLQTLIDGLEANGMLPDYSHLLTGYIGQVSSLEVIVKLVQKLKAVNDVKFTFVLDPVMGDEGRMYVPSEVLPMYRDLLCPLADVVTPNGFEASLLTGIEVTSVPTAIQACDKLHNIGIPIVIITTVELKDRPEHANDSLFLIGSKSASPSHPTPSRFIIPFDKIPGYFTGTGDLFSALLLAHLNEHPDSIQDACVRATDSIQCVLKETVRVNNIKVATLPEGANQGANAEEAAARWRCHELAIVQSRKWLENPERWHKTIPI
ncbi:pyridoxal kinase [Phlyctochytrium arcticum]|nr:pyridoxal kinase [Phlyctochytrium arcticum]